MAVVVSWNVNGMRAVMKYGFLEWFERTRPDILCLQETRVLADELPDEVRTPHGYTSYWNPALKKGYSGTGVYVRSAWKPLAIASMGVRDFDEEGRVQVIRFSEFTILNGYWPNSQPERARLDYKLRFCTAITRLANKLVRDGQHVILCGDFNIAHQELDLARPRENEQSPGYYIEERKAMNRFVGHGYVDTFRHFVKEGGHYTWWSYRSRARERNIGWRIDYHCINEAFVPRLKRAWIMYDVLGSDHCPVAVELK